VSVYMLCLLQAGRSVDLPAREHCNKPFASVKCREFVDWQWNCWLHWKDCGLWS